MSIDYSYTPAEIEARGIGSWKGRVGAGADALSFVLKIEDGEGKNDYMGVYERAAPGAEKVDPLSCAHIDLASVATLMVPGMPTLLGSLVGVGGTVLGTSFRPEDAASLAAPERIPGQVQVRFSSGNDAGQGLTFVIAGDGFVWISQTGLDQPYAFDRATLE